jgi:hypothetical protein
VSDLLDIFFTSFVLIQKNQKIKPAYAETKPFRLREGRLMRDLDKTYASLRSNI